jgi:4-hydroxythreonine-4-phosphate dehydrogenase
MKPRLAITMGDAAGIGPEVIIKALADPAVWEWSSPVVVGDVETIRRDLKFQPPGAGLRVMQTDDVPREATPGVIDVVHVDKPVAHLPYGQVSAETGHAAVRYVQTAVELGMRGVIQGIVTAPLNKEAMQRGGHLYPGHTELLADLFGVERFSLVLTAKDLFIFHVTTHVSLRRACSLVTRDRVLTTIEEAHRFAGVLGRGDEPIAVVGLNPHAGERGLFGTEDRDEIAPAIEAAVAAGIPALGPLPADTLLPQAIQGRYGFIVVMYHDQGHAPFKSVFFNDGVNVTVGLPLIRTSVDHGTAFDIAGQGVADEKSLIAALSLAARLHPLWNTLEPSS